MRCRPSSTGRAACRKNLTTSLPGTWTAVLKWPWMPCAVLPPIPNAGFCQAAKKRRVALCRILLKQPDILLLDEPTNHLDAESVGWLEQHLQSYPGTIIAVTHDRYFLDNVAGWILELDRGVGIPWKGNYSSWLEQKEKTTGYGGKEGKRSTKDPAPGAGMDQNEPEGQTEQIKSTYKLL